VTETWVREQAAIKLAYKPNIIAHSANSIRQNPAIMASDEGEQMLAQAEARVNKKGGMFGNMFSRAGTFILELPHAEFSASPNTAALAAASIR
jgi:hypothetical protein